MHRLSAVLVLILATACSAAPPAIVYPADHWQTAKPTDVSLDPDALKKFSDSIAGRGCIVRHGLLVYTWGDATKPGDVASAAKPIYGFFLFKALEDEKIKSLDDKVAALEPKLADLNRDLAFKDRQITWRHLANQTSCYGVKENPGEAYDYSDWQLALFWDLLFLKVYGATYKTVDEKVLRPGLADPLQFEDRPTLIAFGPADRPGRLAISPRDFCRFGLLYLHQGKWNDKQLISAEHVKLAIATPLSSKLPRTRGESAEMLPNQRSIGGKNNQIDHFGSYSFLWWTNGLDRDDQRHWPDAPTDTYACLGHGGMRALVIIPSLDLIVSWNDTNIDGREKENAALKLLIRSLR